MVLFAIIFLLRVIYATGQDGKETHPVCLFGAGPSGLTVASELQAKNISYMIFEKEGFIGGRAQKYIDPTTGESYSLGPNLMFAERHPVLVDMIQKFNVKVSSNQHSRMFHTFESHSERLGTIVRPELTAAELEAFEKYDALHATYAPYFVPFYEKGFPKDLALPFLDWLQIHKIEILEKFFLDPISAHGYGYLGRTAALYVLNYMHPKVMKHLLGLPGFENVLVRVDFHDLFVKLASTLTGKIILNATVGVLSRDRVGLDTFSYFQNGTRLTQKCSAAIIAFPPDLEILEHFANYGWMDLDIFDKVRTQHLFTGVANASRLDKVAPYINIEAITYPGDVPVPPSHEGPIVRIDHEPKRGRFITHIPPLAKFYAWSTSTKIEDEDVFNLAIETLSRINADIEVGPSNASVPLKKEDIKLFQHWIHFPNVRSDGLMDNFYEKFKDFQGFCSAYWVSGLNSMDTIGNVVQTAKELVATYF